jgi:hypothetical protein
MRFRVNDVVIASTLAAIACAASIARAAEPGPAVGMHQWVPSLAVTSGVTFQRQSGNQSSQLFDGESANPSVPTPLRPATGGDDQAVSPFVGGALELMTPTLSILPRVRLFATAEILPTFATERLVAQEGQPSRIRGPQPNSVLWNQEDNRHFTTDPCPTAPPQRGYCPRSPNDAFGAPEANGQGMQTSAQVDRLVFGAKIGFAYEFDWRGRRMRIKPWLGWLEYKLTVKGYFVNPTCGPGPAGATLCTTVYNLSTTPPTVSSVGHIRESILSGQDSGVFDGIGPGIDLEMDTGRIGPIGTALFLGAGGYYIPGGREISFTAARAYSDFFGNDVNTATWRTRVAPWIYRGGVGIRFQWLGSGD